MTGRFRTWCSVAVAVTMVVVVAGCSDDAVAPVQPKEATTDPCEVITAAEASEVLAADMEVVDDTVSKSACSFAATDRVATASVLMQRTPTAPAYDALVAASDAQQVDGLGDAAAWWLSPEEVGGTLVARRGGMAITVRINDLDLAAAEPPSGEGEDEQPGAQPSEATVGDRVLDRLVALAEVALPRLADVDFDGDASRPVGAARSCDDALGATVSDALDVEPEGVSVTPVGSAGCSISLPEGAGLLLELLPGEAATGSLDGFGRTTGVDGRTYEWVREPVARVGDEAVWLLDPVAGTSGELYARFGTKVVKATSTGPASGPGLRTQAVAAVRAVGPDLEL